MKVSLLTLSLVFGSVGSGTAFWVTAARAESPYERDQREMLERYQQQHGLSPQVQQSQRWQREWRQQHPNEPMPNFAELEKLHRQEITDNMHAGFAKMRQARQAELQRNYQMSRQNQEQKLAAQHITWSAQQWKDWDRDYDLQQQQRAQDYLKAAAQAGEFARAEKAREEEEKARKNQQ
jgi:hypothetical protein